MLAGKAQNHSMAREVDPPLRQAIEAAGGTRALASALGIPSKRFPSGRGCRSGGR